MRPAVTVAVALGAAALAAFAATAVFGVTIDTVNARTKGAGFVDLRSDAVALRFVPRAKVPELFAFTPTISAGGTIVDIRFAVGPADLVGAALRWAASPATVPVQRLAGARLPADGSDVCANPGR